MMKPGPCSVYLVSSAACVSHKPTRPSLPSALVARRRHQCNGGRRATRSQPRGSSWTHLLLRAYRSTPLRQLGAL